MKIAQFLLDEAPLYEQKSQRIDAESLAPDHEVSMWPDPAAVVVHVYGPRELPARLFRRFPRPYVASGTPAGSAPWLARPRTPSGNTSPMRIPEAIDPRYIGEPRRAEKSQYEIGVLVGRRKVRPLVDATANRLARFRDDVQWRLFDEWPTPDEMPAIDLWVDPAMVEEDYDGFTAEALAAGTLVVATRTSVNAQRLDGGRFGFLTPPNDPNELTHAIVTALFKPEAAMPKLEAARAARERFDPARRRDALVALYDEVAR